MSIEFRCTSCDKLLRTPAGTEGKQAKCPQCAQLMTIPAGSAFVPPPREPEFAAAPSAPPYQPRSNPFGAPGTDPAPPAMPASFHPTRVGFTDVLEQTWDIFKNNWLMCVVGALVAHLSMNVASILVGGVLGAIGDNSDDVVAVFAGILGGLAAFAIYTFFTFGMLKYFLGIARSGQANFSDLFSIGPVLWPAMAVAALFALGTTGGLLLLVLPGVLFLLYFCMAPLMFLDQRTGVIDSFRYSATAMSGNKGTILALTVITFFAGMALIVVTCFIGSLVVTPFVILLHAVAYLGVTGQPSSARRAVPSAAERPLYNPRVQPQG